MHADYGNALLTAAGILIGAAVVSVGGLVLLVRWWKRRIKHTTKGGTR